MKAAAIAIVPYLLSAITIYMNLLAGNKHRNAWAVGLVGQLGWSAWILLTWDQNHGFAPMNIALWWVYGRNHLKWRREAK